jgi:hypothetical protein
VVDKEKLDRKTSIEMKFIGINLHLLYLPLPPFDMSHSTLLSRVRTVLLLQIVVPATLLFKLALETSALNNYFAWLNLAHSLQSASDQPPRLTCNSDQAQPAQPR